MKTSENMVFLDTIERLLENYRYLKDFGLIVEPIITDPMRPEKKDYHVIMSYGDAQTEFVTTGFNFVCNMRRLFNNDVFDKLLR